MARSATDNQQPPGFFTALWLTFIRFFGNMFKKSPSTTDLPIPATTRSPNVRVNINSFMTKPSPAKAQVTHQRFNLPRTDWGWDANPLKHRATTSTASSRYPSMARISPARRSRSVTPKRARTNPETMLHPPASPFPNISLSGIFATPPTLASPCLASDVELGRLTLSSPPQAAISTPTFSPGSPPPFRRVPLSIHGSSRSVASRSLHSVHSRSPHTPRTPSSAVLFRVDRSTISPTMMSDGSIEVISLGGRRGFVGTPVKMANVGPLPSPWSPVGGTVSFDVWMTAEGILMQATGPMVNDIVQPSDDSMALRSAILSSLAASRFSDDSLHSASSDLNGLDMSVFVDLDGIQEDFSSKDRKIDTAVKDDAAAKVSDMTEVGDENTTPLVTHISETLRRRRDTVPSITKFYTPVKHTPRGVKCISTPLTKLENVDLKYLRSTNSISSMAYEFRVGLFEEGRSMTAIENIISLLDQGSPKSAVSRTAVDNVAAVIVEAV
ncbi:hypothetical protein BS17DRAFT_767248 [Gyrodon lividus]|nr:hypothetical protein BS17DRAFT_767248 [Gyrodon lividus]